MMPDFFAAADAFVGKTVKDVRLLTDEEVTACFGHAEGPPPPVLTFDDESYLFPSKDDEGNTPGQVSVSDGIAGAEELVGKVVAEFRLLRTDELAQLFDGDQERTTWVLVFTDGTFCYPSRNEDHVPAVVKESLRGIMGERFDHDVGAFFGGTGGGEELTLPVDSVHSGLASQKEWEERKARLAAREQSAQHGQEHVATRPSPQKKSI